MGGLILKTLIVVALLIILFLINFYRDPKRKIPQGNNIISPADGKVMNILKVNKDKVKIKKGRLGKIQTFTKDIAKECYVISVFMNPFDVHVNRAPIEGSIELVKHTKGKFFAAFNIEKSLYNEKNEIVIKNKKAGKIKVIQIAGWLARRIICKVKVKEKVNKGQRIGKIVLGSQVTIIIDAKKVNLRVKKGQKVKAGSSIIAELK
jgi:phosphatidylserine decarboxylase|tara:strand:- start:112 stop:729 length:618 start_codon:yes stop_codon:yes gene_type:complete